ncbi:unnamed protein product, partial [Phaeothamnion confervicola]
MGKKRSRTEGTSGAGGDPDGQSAGAPILSPELMLELCVDDCEAVVCHAKTTTKKKRADEETTQLARQLSKVKQKKLARLADRKAKDDRRDGIYSRLAASQLSPDQQALLSSSRDIGRGKRTTAKVRLARCVQRARAGIVPTAAELSDFKEHDDVLADVEEELGIPVGEAVRAVRAAAAGGGLYLALDNAVNRSNGGGIDGGSGGGKGGAENSTTPEVSVRRRAKVAVKTGSLDPLRSGPDVKGDRGSSSDDEAHLHNGSPNGAGASAAAESPSKVRKVRPPSPPPPLSASTSASLVGQGKSGSGNKIATGWAAKMMQELTALKSASEIARETPGNAVPAPAGTADAAADAEDAESDGGDGPKSDRTSEEGSAQANGGVAYPPPPRWLSEAVPSYVPVETPMLLAAAAASAGGGGEMTAAEAVRAAAVAARRRRRTVIVERPPDLQAVRLQLPACGMEQEIVEAVTAHDVVILCGETGSGKSTQVPQFLHEAGFSRNGVIGVTQPRRVAAVSTAQRVAAELGTPCGRGGAVAYQIRFDAVGVGPETRVKFMTDGILLREATEDLLLRRYSVILLDEAHERNLNTDVL